MSINKLGNPNETDDICSNRAALALALLLSSCSISTQQQSPTTPDPITSAPDRAVAEEFLSGNREVQVNIPAGDNIEKSLADFMQFCESQGVKCEFNRHNSDGDLMKVENNFDFCRPEGGYSITLRNDNGVLRIEKVSEEPSSNYRVSLNELLRGITQNPWMLEAIKQSRLRADGSVASATIPEDQIPEGQMRGEAIPGHPGFIIEKMRFRINCETGAREADFSGYPRKISDNGSFVFIEYNEDGSYSVSHGD